MQICFDKLSKFIFQCVDFGLVHIDGRQMAADQTFSVCNKKNPIIGIFLISKYALLYEIYLSVCSDKMFTRRKYISICQSI